MQLFFTVFFVGHPNKALYNCFAALIRHNQPGVSAFRLGNGYAGLKDALGSDDARLQRYVMIRVHPDMLYGRVIFLEWCQTVDMG